jgi:Family of unknown function (DUF6459)
MSLAAGTTLPEVPAAVTTAGPPGSAVQPAAHSREGSMPPLRTSRPALLGDLRSPAPVAATPTRGHEPPDPHASGTGPKSSFLPERVSDHPGCPNELRPRRPLPDPAAVRLCRIPDPAPPYDADSPGGRPSAAPAGGEGPADGGRRGQPGGGAGRRGGTGERGGAGEHRSAGAVPPGWPSRFAQILAETLAGSRPSVQMVPWTTEMARSHIQRLGPQLASVQRPRVRRVVTFQPASDVLEMTAVVWFGPRVRALAVRLERAGAPPEAGGRRPDAPRWLCTAVEAA